MFVCVSVCVCMYVCMYIIRSVWENTNRMYFYMYASLSDMFVLVCISMYVILKSAMFSRKKLYL